MTAVRYIPGSTPTFVTAGGVLMLAEQVSPRRIDELYAGVLHAQTAREVLVELSGGHLVDLDGLPDFAFVSRRPDVLRVTLRGRVRCVVHDGVDTVELDGSDVALVGEWRFDPHCRVEMSVDQGADGGHRADSHISGAGGGTTEDYPLVAGVVLAEHVRWEADPASGHAEAPNRWQPSTDVSEADPVTPIAPVGPEPQTAPEATVPPEPEVAPEPTVAPAAAPRVPADATLMPELSVPGPPAPPAVVPPERPRAPEGFTPPSLATPQTPVEPEGGTSTAAEMPVDESGVLDSVDYTIGGGIDYERLLGGGGPTTDEAERPPAGDPAQPVAAQQPAPVTWSAFAAGETPDLPGSGAEDFGPGTWITPDRAGDTVPPGTFTPVAPGEQVPGRAVAAEQTAHPTDAPAARPGAEPGAGTTSARLCPQNHANPPHLQTCRICSAPLDGPTVRVARPTLGVVRLSTGVFFDLDRPLVFGREPRIDAFGPDEAPRPIVLPSPDKAISRSHLRIDIDGWSVLAVDLGSKNGTYLRRGAAEEIRLMPDEAKMLMAGDVLVVDDVDIRFEDLP